MKFIKSINEYNSEELFHRIEVDEFNNQIMLIDNSSEKNFKKPSEREMKMIGSILPISNKHEIIFGSDNQIIVNTSTIYKVFIYQNYDEWFYVNLSELEDAYYKCDTIDGLIECLKYLKRYF